MTVRMPVADCPRVEEVLPHAGPMVFLSRVLSHTDDHTVCSVEIDEQALFRDRTGNVPAWVGVEYMAQCIAAHAGLVGRASGAAPQVGLLLGSRRVGFYAACFHPGQTLVVKAHHVWGTSPGLVSFDCSLADASTGARLAEGRLNCFVPDADYAEGGGS